MSMDLSPPRNTRPLGPSLPEGTTWALAFLLASEERLSPASVLPGCLGAEKHLVLARWHLLLDLCL